MTYSDAERQRIIEYLKVKSIHHGQLDISQIYVSPKHHAMPLSKYVEVINQFNANLYPIIVRRTDQYGEDQEYELVYGSDWYQAAKLAQLNRIWVWVFDLNDEQVTQVNQLLNAIPHPQESPPQSVAQLSTQQIRVIFTEVVDQKLHIFSQELDQKLRLIMQNFETKINEILSRLPSPPSAKQNINEVTLRELENHPNHLVQKYAISIFNFIQQHRPINNIKQLEKKIKGVGEKTLKALQETYII